MICPNCDCNLDTITDGDLPVHKCPCCSGTWITGRSLHEMLARSSDAAGIERIFKSILDLDYRQSRRQCPSCAQRNLKIVVIDHTELDFCSSCKGVFFDPGEIESVIPGARKQAGKSTRQSGFRSLFKRLLDNN